MYIYIEGYEQAYIYDLSLELQGDDEVDVSCVYNLLWLFLSNHKEDYNQQYIGLQYNQQIWVCLKWCIASNGNFNRENHDKPMDFGSPS